MLPRWHIFLGAIFTLALSLVFPSLGWIELGLVFLSSFLIDFDHYVSAAINGKRFGLKSIFNYYKEKDKISRKESEKGIYKKGDFHLFHTVEFHALVLIAGILYRPFLFVFIGMAFHSILDIVYLFKEGVAYRREFFFFNWVRKIRFI